MRGWLPSPPVGGCSNCRSVVSILTTRKSSGRSRRKRIWPGINGRSFKRSAAEKFLPGVSWSKATSSRWPRICSRVGSNARLGPARNEPRVANLPGLFLPDFFFPLVFFPLVDLLAAFLERAILLRRIFRIGGSFRSSATRLLELDRSASSRHLRGEDVLVLTQFNNQSIVE